MPAPTIRTVKVRLSGQGEDIDTITALLTHLPALSGGRCQVGEISPPYLNRRSDGERRYLDLYLLSTPDDGEEATS